MKEDLRQHIRAEQIKQLFTLTPVGLIANVVNSAILVFVLWNQIAHSVLLGWFLGIVSLSLLRYLLHFLYHRAEVPPAKASTWGHWFNASIALSGIAWGLAGILLFTTESVAHQVFVAFVLGGMVAGAAAAFSAQKRAFFFFSLPAILPIIVRLFIIGGDIHVAMGAMIVLFALLMVITALRVHRTTVTSFALRFENQDLVDRLRDEIRVREQAEAELKKRRDTLETAVQERTADLVAANKELSQEIRERKAAEEALRDSERKFRAIFDHTFQLIGLMTPDGILTEANRSSLNFGGLEESDVLGKPFWEAPWWTHSLELQDRLHRAVNEAASGNFVRFEVCHPVQDGSLHYVDFSLKPVADESGDIVLLIPEGRDITELKRAEDERRKLEAQMQHAQKLESLGVLAGGIAHDFNNLLTGILGNASLALMKLSPESPVREGIQKIENASLRAADLTKQMLAFAGKGRFVLTTLYLNALVEEMSHLLKTAISKKAVLKHNFADNLPAIEADVAQIQQVIMNLITNASDALGDESGMVTLNTGTVENDQAYTMDAQLSEELSEGLYVYLEVSDTGIGMDEETQDKIFDPFFTTKFVGRGLGLAAVLGIIRGHSGAIRVYSDLGRGTTIRVLFPATESAAEEPIVAPSDSEAWHGTGTVLVVDDEDDVRGAAKSILENSGFTVLIACDGREGVKVFRKHSEEIIAVVLDLTMPQMDGLAAYNEIHRMKPEVPVILTSGYNEQDTTRRFSGKGLAGFIQKPYRSADLIRKLQQILES